MRLVTGIRRVSSVYAAALLGMAVSASADTWLTHPAPGPGGPPHSALTRVSCVSGDFCMTVGASDYGLGRLGLPRRPIATFADRWDGSTWRLLPMPAVHGSPGLMSLSCVSSTFCVAVGSTQTTGRGSAAGFGGRAKPRALVETWDGTAWTVRPTPLASSPDSALSGVSCVSSSFCIAVGTSGLAWDGTSWTRLRLPSVRYGSSLSAIACVAAEDCWAVGSYNAYKAGPDGTRPLAAHWLGGRWTVARLPAESDRFQSGHREQRNQQPDWPAPQGAGHDACGNCARHARHYQRVRGSYVTRPSSTPLSASDRMTCCRPR